MITPSNFTLQPGKTQGVKLKFTEPPNLDPTTFPVYSGFIEVNSESESLHAVYLGMVGDLRDKQVLDNTSSVFGFQLPAIINPHNDQPQAQFTNYTYNGTDNPLVFFRFGPFPFPSFVSPFIGNFLHVQDDLWIAITNYRPSRCFHQHQQWFGF